MSASDENAQARDIRDLKDDRQADELGTARFAAAMLEKLDQKRREGIGGWNRMDNEHDLWDMIYAHVYKGDVLDVANLAMMVWNLQNPIGVAKGETPT